MPKLTNGMTEADTCMKMINRYLNEDVPTYHLPYNMVTQDPKKLFLLEKSARKSFKQMID